MKGLLRKDIYMAAQYYRAVLLVVAVFLLLTIFGDGSLIFLAYPTMISGMLPITLLSYDTHFKWEQYSGTLPYTRAQLVTVKYLVGLIFSGGVLLVCLGVLALRQILGEGFDLDTFLGAAAPGVQIRPGEGKSAVFRPSGGNMRHWFCAGANRFFDRIVRRQRCSGGFGSPWRYPGAVPPLLEAVHPFLPKERILIRSQRPIAKR